jgi:hypothetical protein
VRPLSDFESNVYSQFGEDGIVAECLRRISEVVDLDRWCVEFGAWDGVHLSNTCRLIREQQYSAVLIEGDPDRYEELKRNLPESRVKKVLQWVSLEGANSLDTILGNSEIPGDFDFLSIDIDSCDWHVWNSLKAFNPKVVCVEFNPTVPNACSFVQEADFSVKHGCGAKSLWDLGVQKGYVAVAGTMTNLIFVREDFIEAVLGDSRPSLDVLRPERNTTSYVFCGYDGEVILSQPIQLLWHGMSIGPRRLQVLPKWLRVFPDDYSFFQKLGFWFARGWWKITGGRR